MCAAVPADSPPEVLATACVTRQSLSGERVEVRELRPHALPTGTLGRACTEGGDSTAAAV